MSGLKSLIAPFFIGGSVLAGVKYTSEHIKNPLVSAVIGGIPTGLIAIFLISSKKSIDYSYQYFFVTLSLLISIALFHILIVYTHMHKNTILILSLICWVFLIAIIHSI